MNQACVTLEEVLAAATARAASVVSETSGYLTLALGDANRVLVLEFGYKAEVVRARKSETAEGFR